MFIMLTSKSQLKVDTCSAEQTFSTNAEVQQKLSVSLLKKN
jgi:hypothetical protein